MKITEMENETTVWNLYSHLHTLQKKKKKKKKMFEDGNPEMHMGRNSWKIKKGLLQLLLFLICHFQKAWTENKITQWYNHYLHFGIWELVPGLAQLSKLSFWSMQMERDFYKVPPLAGTRHTHKNCVHDCLKRPAITLSAQETNCPRV